MAKHRSANTLYIGINGIHVGVLERRGGVHSFTYDDAWLSNDYGYPISLSFPITTQRHTGDAVRSYFDNLLPDDNEIRTLIVDRVGAYSTDTMDLLSEIGKDCVGAISLTNEPINGMEPLRLEPMTREDVGAHLMKAAKRRTLGMDDENTFRISLAGMQEKTALTMMHGKWYRPLGTTPTTHIFKLEMGDLGQGFDFANSVDNEWFCLRFMHHLGFDVAQATIDVFNNMKVLVVERYDRLWHDDYLYRIAQEDMCQALGRASQSKYESRGGPGAKQISEVLRYAVNSEDDLLTFFAAQYVYWLLMGIDGHAKNFSIFHDPDGYWLTPIYDVLSAHPIRRQVQIKELKMAMKVHSKNTHYKWVDILARHWLGHAKHCGLNTDIAMRRIDQINADVEYAIESTLKEANEYFDTATGHSIAEGIRGMRL